MKQMISNHSEIESLQDFIYYDKVSGKIKFKKGVNLTVSDGVISKVLGVDSSGNMVKGEVSGGTKLYKHTMTISISMSGTTVDNLPLVLIATNNTIELIGNYTILNCPNGIILSAFQYNGPGAPTYLVVCGCQGTDFGYSVLLDPQTNSALEIVAITNDVVTPF